jgi:chromosome segregation ATPase
MIEKVNLRQVLTVVAIGLAMCFMFSMFSKPSTNINKLQADTDRSLGTIKAESSMLGVGVERSQTASDNAQQAIAGVRAKINGSRETFNDFRAGINELERLLSECQRLAEQNTNIIDRIDGANQ